MLPRSAQDLLALDPSVRSAGAALFRRGRLIACKTIKRKSAGGSCDAEKCLLMAADVMAWCAVVGAQPTVLVFEWPQVYDVGKSEVPPGDLVPLAGVGMAVAGMLMPGCAARNVILDLSAPLPAEWIDNLPKTRTGDPWRSPRGARVAARLDAEERRRVPAQHDAVDAAGLGLFALERFGRVRVFPGAAGQ